MIRTAKLHRHDPRKPFLPRLPFLANADRPRAQIILAQVRNKRVSAAHLNKKRYDLETEFLLYDALASSDVLGTHHQHSSQLRTVR
jgi:hypothetical protein